MILDPLVDPLQSGIKSVSLSTRCPVCVPSGASLWNEKKVPLFLGPAWSLSAASSTLVIFFRIQRTRQKLVTSEKQEHVSTFAANDQRSRWMGLASRNFWRERVQLHPSNLKCSKWQTLNNALGKLTEPNRIKYFSHISCINLECRDV